MCTEVTVNFEKKEYLVEEGNSEAICLVFDDTVQRSFVANVTSQTLLDLIEGTNYKQMYTPVSLHPFLCIVCSLSAN